MIDGGTIIKALKYDTKCYNDSCVTYSNPMLNDILEEACSIIDSSGPLGALDWISDFGGIDAHHKNVAIVVCLLLA